MINIKLNIMFTLGRKWTDRIWDTPAHRNIKALVMFQLLSFWLGSWVFIICFIYCSATQSCTTLCNPMDCSTLGFPVLHCLLEFAQTQVHWVGDTIQPSHPLLPPSPPALNLSQHQDNFQWVRASHQVAKVLELQPRHQSFQWVFRVDFL